MLRPALILLASCLFATAALAHESNPGQPMAATKSTKTDVGGSVVDASDNDGLAGVTVTVYKGGQKFRSTTTNAQGGFSFDELLPANYRFVFEKDGYKRVSKEKTIDRVDASASLNVVLEASIDFDFMNHGPAGFFE